MRIADPTETQTAMATVLPLVPELEAELLEARSFAVAVVSEVSVGDG
jgi:hypothetical protein